MDGLIKTIKKLGQAQQVEFIKIIVDELLKLIFNKIYEMLSLVSGCIFNIKIGILNHFILQKIIQMQLQLWNFSMQLFLYHRQPYLLAYYTPIFLINASKLFFYPIFTIMLLTVKMLPNIFDHFEPILVLFHFFQPTSQKLLNLEQSQPIRTLLHLNEVAKINLSDRNDHPKVLLLEHILKEFQKVYQVKKCQYTLLIIHQSSKQRKWEPIRLIEFQEIEGQPHYLVQLVRLQNNKNNVPYLLQGYLVSFLKCIIQLKNHKQMILMYQVIQHQYIQQFTINSHKKMDKDFKKKQLFDDDEPIKANKDKKMDQLNLSNAVSINGCVIEQNDQQVKEFAKYPIEENLSDALKKMGYIYPTKIQSKALQHSLGDGDLLCLSETGSGKTLSFLIPIVNFILRNIEQAKPGMALILAPTRQLCLQIQDYLIRFRQQDLSQCTSVVLHGGADTKMKQVLQLTKKPRIIIGTPGRILDHLQNTKGFNLKNMKYLILDEADKLLNLDFQKQINQILQLIPKQNRNAYLYSATLTSKVDKLQRVSLHNPTRIQVNSKYHTVQQLDQSFIFIPSKWKDCYLIYLLNRFKQERAIIFVKTCLGVQRLFLTLKQLNFKCDCLHGQLSQTQRQKSLQKFKRNQIRILVCTDVASRGIDIPDISMVINYDICTPKDYIHRVGRTARIGKQGRAISVVTQYDVETFQQVEKKLGKKINQLKTDKQQALVFLQILERTHQTVSRQMKKKHKH